MNKDTINFNFKNLLKQSWQDYKQRPYFLSLVTLLILVLTWVNQAYSNATQNVINFWLGLLGLAIVLFLIQVLAGSFKLILKAINNNKPKFQDLLVGFKHFFRFFGVLAMFFVLGITLVVITSNAPIIIWSQTHVIWYDLFAITAMFGFVYLIVSLQFVFFAIINYGFFAAIGQSWQIVRGYRLKLVWFWIVIIIFNIIGAAVLGVGLLVTLPLSFLAFARVYQQLQLANKVEAPKNQRDA